MTAAIVLAAGRGARFGGGKMLAEVEGRPMLQHVLDLAAEANLDPVIVVLGDEADAVEAAITWRGEVRIRNENPGRGISNSVALGLDALTDANRALVLLGDHPRLTFAQLRTVTSTVPDPERPIIVPRYGGKPGNPVLLERAAWRLAERLHGDRGMSQLFARHPDLVRFVDVVGTNPDIDTPADLAALSRDGGSVRSDRMADGGRRRP